ncbi:hypothetical protein BDR04DRAFT_1123027 [Suillus decipiens]|nr:hypothetical protein BDR04DRAFT_1123027 [Suillus decipiens]
MEERMYQAQMEVSLFSKAIANLCEELKVKCCPSTWSKMQIIQEADKDPDTHQLTQLVDVNHLLFEVDFPQAHEIPKLYEHLSRHDNFIPPLMEAWLGHVTHHTYITTSFADSKPLCISNSESFRAKKNKTLDALKSNFSILELKKQRAQAEVDMFSEVIYSDDGLPVTFALVISH